MVELFFYVELTFNYMFFFFFFITKKKKNIITKTEGLRRENTTLRPYNKNKTGGGMS